MKTMNENRLVMPLREFMDSADGWGHEHGQAVHAKLLKALEANPGKTIVQVSLTGVRRTDASFPRESVVELARRYRRLKGFYLTDAEDQDLLDNWDAAATKRDQPLIFWKEKDFRVLGPKPSRGSEGVFEFLMGRESTTASEAAGALGLKLSNSSSKLKQLLENGFALRREETAPSGGLEYVYLRIR